MTHGDPTTIPLLAVRHISKSFPGVRALSGVSLEVHPGEVLAVIGENGAGKSTLMKILAGVQEPDEGEILFQGQPVRLRSVEEALAHGIVLIHQELNLSDNLDIASNLFLGREKTWYGLIDRRGMERASKKYLEQVGLDVSPRRLVRDFSIGQQQQIEIAKALSADAKVIIMDEPTSSLSGAETQKLFEIVRQLQARGVAIIYISHRLGEVQELADKVVVLRDGARVGELRREEITHDRMVSMMVGRDVSRYYARTPYQRGEVALEVEQLETSAWPGVRNSFRICRGEVVGMAGLVGAGRTELLETLFGIRSRIAGKIRVKGQGVEFAHPSQAVEHGIMLVPEDRKQHGVILEENVTFNASLPSAARESWAGMWLRHGKLNRIADEAIRTLTIRPGRRQQLVKFLSGGNQQKVVIAKWLAMAPAVLLLDEPTRGIDVGAKEEIYKLMDQLADQGMAILFVSSEMEEILGMSDRVLVMHEGRITGELHKSELSEDSIMKLATGVTSETAPIVHQPVT